MNQFSVIELAKLVLHKIWLVILCFAVMLSIGLIYCKVIAKPRYAASADILVASGELFKPDVDPATQSTYITSAELNTSFALMKSFSSVLTKSDDYYELVLEEVERLESEKGITLDGEYSVKQLKAVTAISVEEDSIIITISATTGSKRDSTLLVNALANIAPDFICSHIGRTSSMKLNVDDVAGKVYPQTTRTCIILAFVGAVGAILFILICAFLDRSIKSEEDFTEHYDIPLLGSIPEFRKPGKKRRA